MKEKEVICEKYELCNEKFTASSLLIAPCVHMENHNEFQHDLFGCNECFCSVIGANVHCISVRKMKLDKIKIDR